MEKYPEVINNERCIVVDGDVLSGLRFIGPFDTRKDAVSFCWTRDPDVENEWIIAPLQGVQCDENGSWIMPDGDSETLDTENMPKCAR